MSDPAPPYEADKPPMDPIYKVVIALAIIAALFAIALAIVPKPPLYSNNTVRNYFETLHHDFLDVEKRGDDTAIQAFVTRYYAPNAVISSDVVSVDIPTDSLMFEGYDFLADEYAWVIGHERYKISSINRNKKIKRINIIQDGRLARIEYEFHSTLQVSREAFSILSNPLALSYDGTCVMIVEQRTNWKRTLVTEDRCKTHITGHYIDQ